MTIEGEEELKLYSVVEKEKRFFSKRIPSFREANCVTKMDISEATKKHLFLVKICFTFLAAFCFSFSFSAWSRLERVFVQEDPHKIYREG